MFPLRLAPVAICVFATLNFLIGSVSSYHGVWGYGQNTSVLPLEHTKSALSHGKPWRKSGPLQAWDT